MENDTPRTAVKISAPSCLEDFCESFHNDTLMIVQTEQNGSKKLILANADESGQKEFDKCIKTADNNCLQGTHDLLRRVFSISGVNGVFITRSINNEVNEYEVTVMHEEFKLKGKNKDLYEALLGALNTSRFRRR